MHLLADLRYALRGLRNKPGFAVAIVLTLALGIGANAAMFSVIDRLLFRPPPMLRDAALTHRIYLTWDNRGNPLPSGGLPFARYTDLSSWTTSFRRTAAFTVRPLAIGTGEDAVEMQVGAVSASFFGFFDAPPVLGRYFTAAEDTPPNGTAVMVLSYGFWQSRFGGRSDVLGKALQTGATVYTIIGVAPRGFVGLSSVKPPVAYIPVSAFGRELGAELMRPGESWATTYDWTWSEMIAQRKPGVSVELADADLSTALVKSIEAESAARHARASGDRPKVRATVASILAERGPKESDDTKVATWVAGVAAIVWLIACANIANLLLGRALRRRREIALRIALGVTRARLAQQLLMESLLLCLLGGAAGLIVAEWGGALLRAEFLPESAGATVLADPRTLLFAGVTALAAGLLTGVAPVLQTGRVDLTHDLKAGVREGITHRSRLRATLLVFQGALSVVLLVGAGLFVRSVRNVQSVSLGYEPKGVLATTLAMRGTILDSTQSTQLRRNLLEAARTIPGVQHASLGVTMPFWSQWVSSIFVDGIDSVGKLGDFDLNAVTPDYFAVMGTRILRGRGITDADVAGAPRAIVVTDAMGKLLWPDKDALGQCVKVGAETAPCSYVVGVAENIKERSVTAYDRSLTYWVSWAQYAPQQGELYLRMQPMRTQDRELVRRKLQAVMPGTSYITVRPFEDAVAEQTRSWRLGATMFSLFGALALVLAAIGLYSVIAYNVEQRTHELGVRVALGAQMRDLVGLVVSEGMRVTVVGVVVGAGIALAGSRWIAPLLFEESARDPLVYGAVVVVLLGIAALASFVPSRRAGKVDPITALRAE